METLGDFRGWLTETVLGSILAAVVLVGAWLYLCAIFLVCVVLPLLAIAWLVS